MMSMKIAKGMFSTFPHLMCKGLPPYEQLTFIWLFHHANAEGVCFPSINTLAEECGMSRYSIKRSLKSLENKGYIGKEIRKRDDGGNTSNLYAVYFLDCANTAEGAANTPNPLSANTAEGVANTATNYNHLTKIKKPELNISSEADSHSDSFLDVWNNIYPHNSDRGSKEQAHHNWNALLKAGINEQDLYSSAVNYRKFCDIKQQQQFRYKCSNFYGKAKYYEGFIVINEQQIIKEVANENNPRSNKQLTFSERAAKGAENLDTIFSALKSARNNNPN